MSATPLPNLNRKKKQELIEIAVSLGVQTEGTREEIAERIRAHFELPSIGDTSNPTSYINTPMPSSLSSKKKSPKEAGSPSKPKRVRSTSVQHIKSEPDSEGEMSKHSEVFGSTSTIKVERDAKIEYNEGEGSASGFYEEDTEDVGSTAIEVAQEMADEAKNILSSLETETSEIAALVEETSEEVSKWLAKVLRVESIYASMKIARKKMSNSRTILVTILLFEYIAYLQSSLPRTYHLPIAPVTIFGRELEFKYPLPNLFLILHSDFWYPLFAWISGLIVLPMTAAFFVNLEARRHHYYSPLTFAVARFCLVLYASHSWTIMDPLFNRIEPFLMMMGSAIIGVFSFFESFVKH